MMLGEDRDSLRRQFAAAWAKARAGQPLTALEHRVAEVIAAHPEYQPLLEGEPSLLQRDFNPDAGEGNPFLHMGLHLAIREQVATDRPAGIRAVHQRLTRRLGDPLAAEHQMMECLGIALWEAQRFGHAPDEANYLHCLRRLG